jgi:hypothetical protein
MIMRGKSKYTFKRGQKPKTSRPETNRDQGGRGRRYVPRSRTTYKHGCSIGRNSRAGRLGYSGSGTQTREFRRFLGLWAKCSPKASFFTLELDGASLQKRASDRASIAYSERYAGVKRFTTENMMTS